MNTNRSFVGCPCCGETCNCCNKLKAAHNLETAIFKEERDSLSGLVAAQGQTIASKSRVISAQDFQLGEYQVYFGHMMQRLDALEGTAADNSDLIQALEGRAAQHDTERAADREIIQALEGRAAQHDTERAADRELIQAHEGRIGQLEEERVRINRIVSFKCREVAWINRNIENLRLLRVSDRRDLVTLQNLVNTQGRTITNLGQETRSLNNRNTIHETAIRRLREKNKRFERQERDSQMFFHLEVDDNLSHNISTLDIEEGEVEEEEKKKKEYNDPPVPRPLHRDLF